MSQETDETYRSNLMSDYGETTGESQPMDEDDDWENVDESQLSLDIPAAMNQVEADEYVAPPILERTPSSETAGQIHRDFFTRIFRPLNPDDPHTSYESQIERQIHDFRTVYTKYDFINLLNGHVTVLNIDNNKGPIGAWYHTEAFCYERFSDFAYFITREFNQQHFDVVFRKIADCIYSRLLHQYIVTATNQHNNITHHVIYHRSTGNRRQKDVEQIHQEHLQIVAMLENVRNELYRRYEAFRNTGRLVPTTVRYRTTYPSAFEFENGPSFQMSGNRIGHLRRGGRRTRRKTAVSKRKTRRNHV
jgi:hypothetical protein